MLSSPHTFPYRQNLENKYCRLLGRSNTGEARTARSFSFGSWALRRLHCWPLWKPAPVYTAAHDALMSNSTELCACCPQTGLKRRPLFHSWSWVGWKGGVKYYAQVGLVGGYTYDERPIFFIGKPPFKFGKRRLDGFLNVFGSRTVLPEESRYWESKPNLAQFPFHGSSNGGNCYVCGCQYGVGDSIPGQCRASARVLLDGNPIYGTHRYKQLTTQAVEGIHLCILSPRTGVIYVFMLIERIIPDDGEAYAERIGLIFVPTHAFRSLSLKREVIRLG